MVKVYEKRVHIVVHDILYTVFHYVFGLSSAGNSYALKSYVLNFELYIIMFCLLLKRVQLVYILINQI